MRGSGLISLGAACLFLSACDSADQRPPGQPAERSPAQAAERAEQDRQAILRLESEWAAALAGKNLAWYDRHVAPDYVTIASSGRLVPRAEVVALVRNSPPPRDLKIEQGSVRLFGDTAVATVTQSFTLANGKPARLRITDVWRRSPGAAGWVAVHSHESSVAAAGS